MNACSIANGLTLHRCSAPCRVRHWRKIGLGKRLITHRIIWVIAILGVAACEQAPDIGPPVTEAERNAPFPTLLPLHTLLAQGQTVSRITPDTTADLTGRIANLRARAAGLNRPVVDPATRATMRAAVARAALR